MAATSASTNADCPGILPVQLLDLLAVQPHTKKGLPRYVRWREDEKGWDAPAAAGALKATPNRGGIDRRSADRNRGPRGCQVDCGVGSNWDSGVVPAATDGVVLSSSADVTPTAHVTTPNGNVLNVSVVNGNRLSVETGGSFKTTGTSTLGPDVSIGSNGSSGSFVMSGGTVNVDGQFVVGRGNDSSGTFQISGGKIVATRAFVLAGTGKLFDPSNATGTGTQTGGTINSLDFVSIAQGGTATYTLSGGSLNASNAFNVSDTTNSNGTFNLSGSGSAGGTSVYLTKSPNTTGVVNQSGGTMRVGVLGLVFGLSAGSSGTYNLSGGVLDMQGNRIAGPHTGSTATFTMTGGQIKRASAVDVALDQEGGTFSPGFGNGVGNSSIADYTLGDLAVLDIDIAGASSFDELSLQRGKTVNLRGRLNVNVSYKPALGERFTIMLNQQGTLSGTFAGLPEGSTFVSGDVLFKITYKGNNLSDVILTVQAVPEPGPVVALSLMSMGVLFGRRPRRWATVSES
jgi:hypothetical protein